MHYYSTLLRIAIVKDIIDGCVVNSLGLVMSTSKTYLRIVSLQLGRFLTLTMVLEYIGLIEPNCCRNLLA